MTHRTRKIALCIGLAAPILAASATSLLAGDSDTFRGYCTNLGCVGGPTVCAVYEYPNDGGTLTCGTTLNQT